MLVLRKSFVVGACAALLVAGASTARAETITVNSTLDRPDADLQDGVCDADLGTAGLQCTLRAAIQHANATAGTHVIVVPAGRYRLTIRGSGENAGATGDLDITGNVSVQGAGASSTVIDCAKAKDRAFDVRSSAVATISGFTITRGTAPSSESGGGIRDLGDVTVSDCVISKCRAGDDAGGFDIQSGSGTLERVWITKCRARDDGGAIDVDGGSLFLDSCTLSKCFASSEGGGIENSSVSVAMVNCTVSSNKANLNAGGISVEEAGSFFLTNCTVAFNRAKKAGGISIADEAFGANLCSVTSSIVAFNRGGNADKALVSNGGNIDSEDTCGFDHPRTNPKLSRLAANGALAPSHAIGATSPANGIADCTEGLTVDQRGAPRGNTCDAGSYEYNDAP